MNKREEFAEVARLAAEKGVLKKLVFSKPDGARAQRVSGRLCKTRLGTVLQLEYSLPDNTVSQKNVPEKLLGDEIMQLLMQYKQANLITTVRDAEWRVSKKGKETLLSVEALKSELCTDKEGFISAVEELDKRKNYILSGSEEFLIKLGISDKGGRVHDKKQGKFRQINRFLEHISDIYPRLAKNGRIVIYDLCCGKSYLSFAVYYYLTSIKGREASLLGIDLKRDVIEWCSRLKDELGFSGMRFICDDIKNTPEGERPDMVISLHACDIATDIVIDRAIELSAPIILSTPCCHKYLNDKIKNSELDFVTRYPHLRNKLCEAITDAIRAMRLEAYGYKVSVLELTDPENTPKNTFIRAIKQEKNAGDRERGIAKYKQVLSLILGDGASEYLSEIK